MAFKSLLHWYFSYSPLLVIFLQLVHPDSQRRLDAARVIFLHFAFPIFLLVLLKKLQSEEAAVQV